jgi:phytoene synthase
VPEGTPDHPSALQGIDLKKCQPESLHMTKRAKTFSWSAMFLPQDIKIDLNELYSFCRYVDDCADNCIDKIEALEDLDRVTTDLLKGGSRTEVVDRFIKLAHRRRIPISFALELVRGVKADLGEVRVLSEEELLRYAYQVAGTVGVMICHLLSVTDRNALAAGIDLAIGMQLTNIARDVYEDYNQGRVYLPASLVSEQLVADAFANDQSAQKKLLKAVEHILAIAKTYYRSSDEGICYLPQSARLGILVASRTYEKIGHLIVSNPARYFQSRVSTNKLEKFACLADALLSLTDLRYHRVMIAPAHRPELHRALRGLLSFDAV